MKHYSWTYLAGGGKTYNVSLYHGSKSGHVLIVVGTRIITIDFKVFKSKEYTFFIEEELCKVKLERRGDDMYYFFEIDKVTDTPLNRVRWARDRKHTRQLIIGLSVFGILVAATTIWFVNSKKNYVPSEQTLLDLTGRETIGKVTIQPGESEPEVAYHFIANNSGYSSEPELKSQPLIVLETGLPLESGDEFTVVYAAKNPTVSRILFDQPTEGQLEKYFQRVTQKYLEFHPNEAPQIAECKVQVAYSIAGLSGLADFYFQNISPEQNPTHNQTTYLRLTRDLPFQKKVDEDCW